ncbi:MAG: phosphatase PAP2 family protein, partial [Candidatus Dojkabacteria bacterium]
IPLTPIFVIPYLLAIFSWLITIIYVNLWQKKSAAINFDIKLIAAGILSSVIYLVIPTFVNRVVVNGNDIFSNILKAIYSNDESFSAAPSGHTFYTVLCLITLNKLLPKYKVLWFAIAILIILSTLFIKQHNILDAVLGILFALIISFLVDKIKVGED